MCCECRAAADTAAAGAREAPARSRWARLLARIYEAFPLLCPGCGAEMRILAFSTAAEPVDVILRHLGLPATPPPLSPARGPPQHDLDFDVASGPACDPTSPSLSRTTTPIRAPAPEAVPHPPGHAQPAATRPIQIRAARVAIEAT
jgi:hypothetical protein